MSYVLLFELCLFEVNCNFKICYRVTNGLTSELGSVFLYLSHLRVTTERPFGFAFYLGKPNKVANCHAFNKSRIYHLVLQHAGKCVSESTIFWGGMPPDPPRGQGPPGLADWDPRDGDSNSPDSPEGRGKSRNVTL